MYKGGILSEDGFPNCIDMLSDAAVKKEVISDSPYDKPNTLTSEDYSLQYEQLTHSTVLIGWGTETKADGTA